MVLWIMGILLIASFVCFVIYAMKGGNLTIGGLPFANGNTTNSTSGTFGDIQGFANYDIYPYLLANSHLIRIRRRNAQGVASYLPAMDVVGTTFAFSMTYVTN